LEGQPGETKSVVVLISFRSRHGGREERKSPREGDELQKLYGTGNK